VVCPLQYQFATDACLGLQSLAAGGLGTFLQQFFDGVDTCVDEFLCINVTNAFYVNNLLVHSQNVLG
jgi:hypothetical protein